ncbi:amidohydrolase [Priestia koreensis]|uniref:amidohydrolase n=1 Tax=Priestia koreensis TaxID=284581 RepID=UPI003CCBE84D
MLNVATLWFGGTIYTMVNEHETVEAILVEDGTILETGSVATLQEKYENRINEKINLQGKVLYPGFVDSHIHLIGHGEKLLRLDLSAATSAEEVLQLVEEKVKTTPHNEWIIAEGWDENQWKTPRIIHRKELDAITSNHPIIMKRICRHALIANTYALTLSGVTNDVKEPQGGIVDREEDGTITGFLVDEAQQLVTSKMPLPSENYLQRALQLSVQDAFSKGLTGAHSEDLNYYGGFLRTYETFQQVINGSKTKFRAHLLAHYGVAEDAFSYADHHEDPFIEIGAMKIFADGSLGGRSALLSKPYEDDETTQGVAIHTQDELSDLVKKARTFGRTVAIHAIGDLAFEYVITSLEKHPPKAGQRDRIIHAQILRPDLIERAKTLPMILDIQPRFVASDFPWVEERLGHERMKSCYVWKTLIQKGFHCAGGSDAPIEPMDPLLGIHAAVSRKNSPASYNVYMPEEKLSVFEAVRLFTYESAYAINRENEVGLVSPGYKADFTVLNHDLFNIEEDEIPNAGVYMTVVDGTTMFQQ